MSEVTKHHNASPGQLPDDLLFRIGDRRSMLATCRKQDERRTKDEFCEFQCLFSLSDDIVAANNGNNDNRESYVDPSYREERDRLLEFGQER